MSVVWYLGHCWQALLPISFAYVSRGQGWQTGIFSLKPFPLTIREWSVCPEYLPGSQLTMKRHNTYYMLYVHSLYSFVNICSTCRLTAQKVVGAQLLSMRAYVCQLVKYHWIRINCKLCVCGKSATDWPMDWVNRLPVWSVVSLRYLWYSGSATLATVLCTHSVFENRWSGLVGGKPLLKFQPSQLGRR